MIKLEDIDAIDENTMLDIELGAPPDKILEALSNPKRRAAWAMVSPDGEIIECEMHLPKMSKREEKLLKVLCELGIKKQLEHEEENVED